MPENAKRPAPQKRDEPSRKNNKKRNCNTLQFHCSTPGKSDKGYFVKMKNKNQNSAVGAVSIAALLLVVAMFAYLRAPVAAQTATAGGTADEAPAPTETNEPIAAAQLACEIATPAAAPAPAETEEPQAEEEEPEPLYTETDKIALAQMVWGEARNCSEVEQAAAVWCALNRFDSEDPYFTHCETITEIVQQESQFHGYSAHNPIEEDIFRVVEDVLRIWEEEQRAGETDGRVLPAEYLFFHGDGLHNYFTTEYRGGMTWTWSERK